MELKSVKKAKKPLYAATLSTMVSMTLTGCSGVRNLFEKVNNQMTGGIVPNPPYETYTTTNVELGGEVAIGAETTQTTTQPELQLQGILPITTDASEVELSGDAPIEVETDCGTACEVMGKDCFDQDTLRQIKSQYSGAVFDYLHKKDGEELLMLDDTVMVCVASYASMSYEENGIVTHLVLYDTLPEHFFDSLILYLHGMQELGNAYEYDWGFYMPMSDTNILFVNADLAAAFSKEYFAKILAEVQP